MRGVTLSVCLLGCSTAAPPGPPPEVVLGGCGAVRPGPLCVDPTDAVAFVALGPDERLVAPPTSEPAPGGVRVRLAGDAPVTLQVEGKPPVTVRFAVGVPSLGRALHAEGRQANRAGETSQATRLLVEAATAQADVGDASGAALSAQLAAFVEQKQGRLAAARERLAAFEPPAADGAGRALHAYFAALVARAGGDARAALRGFDAAAALAERLALPLQPVIIEERAMTHLVLGRVDEAVATLRGLISDDVPICKRSFLLTNLGWALLGSEAAGAPETGEILARAEEGYAACEATTPDMRANARLNRALWALRARQPDLALSLVEVPLGEGVRPDVRAWTRYVQAALRPPAERGPALEAVARVAEDAGLEHLRWRALVDAGRAFEAVDQGDEAVARFAAAEAVVAARAFDIPVDAGRGAFAADRQESAARLVEALWRQGQPAQALDAARRARRRVMTTLPTDRLIEGLSEADRAAWEAALLRYREAREALKRDAAADWERSGAALAAAQAARADRVRALRGLLDAAVARLGRPASAEGALRGPEAGEIILLWEALADGRWLVFAQDAEGTVAAEVTPGAWTVPVRDRIAAAQRVRVLAAGPLAEARLDLAGRPAVHALDLPPRAPRALGPATMLVADPTGDLPGARQEADRVAPLLAAAGRPATRLTGAAVTRAALTDALGAADHLHYAGHGRYAGFEGWDSALPVHDGTLEVGDLLLLPRVPAAVVLSGCETGRARGDAAVGLGLAHAFLVRGADAVVAPIGPVDDRIAADFAVALYRALAETGRLEAAFGAVAADSSAQDYRLFVP